MNNGKVKQSSCKICKIVFIGNYRQIYCEDCSRSKKRNKQLSRVNGSISAYLKYKLYACRASSNRRNLKFSITFDDLLEIYLKQNGLCAITKVPLICKLGIGRDRCLLSVDRRNNSIGYTKDNIQLVCDIINLMKLDSNMEEFVCWCDRVVKNNSSIN